MSGIAAVFGIIIVVLTIVLVVALVIALFVASIKPDALNFDLEKKKNRSDESKTS